VSPVRLGAERALLAALAGLLAAFLATPLLALVASATPAEIAAGLASPLVGPALRLSLATTSATLAIVVALGTPLAWLLAGSRGPAPRALEAALQLPIVVPPAVAGVALLLAFGRRGVVARWLGSDDVAVAFTTSAVVIAQVFVAAPLYLQAATTAFRRVDPRLIAVARTLGASPLRVLLRLGLPIAARGLVAGAATSWARALGEFGATLMFAGNLEGVTQTLPLAIYTALASDMRAAQALSIVLVAVALALLVAVRVAAPLDPSAEARR
jgi:molybdate transport system permease protein